MNTCHFHKQWSPSNFSISSISEGGCSDSSTAYSNNSLAAIVPPSDDEHQNTANNTCSPSEGSTTVPATSFIMTFDQIRKDFQLTEDALKNASSLEAVMERFDADVARKSLNYSFTLVTDGQLHIRQLLLPEAQRKNIKLPSYYYQFHDLQKEYAAAKPNSGGACSLEDMLKGRFHWTEYWNSYNIND